MDVITDWVNGSNLIINGDVIWGGIMVSLPFLPMTIVMLFIAFESIARKSWKGFLLLIFLLPSAAFFTPLYIFTVFLAALLRLYHPLIEDEEKVLGGWVDGEAVKHFPAQLRMVEVVGESYPQALVGESPTNDVAKLHL